MHFLVIWTPKFWSFFPNHGRFERKLNILERGKALEIYRDIGGCILEFYPEGLGGNGTKLGIDCWPSLEVRGISLDISKAFDWVWHEKLIYKLQSLGISGLPLKFIRSFLTNRFKRVLLNNHSSSWLPVLGDLIKDLS